MISTSGLKGTLTAPGPQVILNKTLVLVQNFTEYEKIVLIRPWLDGANNFFNIFVKFKHAREWEGSRRIGKLRSWSLVNP